MKKITFGLVLSFIASSSFAQDYNSILGLTTTEKENIQKDAIEKMISTYEGKIDSVELKTGTILYDTEIDSIIYEVNGKKVNLPKAMLKLPQSSSMKLNSTPLFKKVGGDGSGGG